MLRNLSVLLILLSLCAGDLEAEDNYRTTFQKNTFPDQNITRCPQDVLLAAKVDIHSALGKEWDKNLCFDKSLDSNKQQIILQHIEQLELLLLKIELMDTAFVQNENASSKSSTTSPIHLSPTEATYQELLSDPDHLRSLIAALKTTSENQESVISEMVVAAAVPLERQKESAETEHPQQLVIANESLKIKKLYSNGNYKVRLGKYRDYETASAVIKMLNTSFTEKDVFLLIDQQGRYKTYQILVKGFENQQEASDFVVALRLRGFSTR